MAMGLGVHRLAGKDICLVVQSNVEIVKCHSDNKEVRLLCVWFDGTKTKNKRRQLKGMKNKLYKKPNDPDWG